MPKVIQIPVSDDEYAEGSGRDNFKKLTTNGHRHGGAFSCPFIGGDEYMSIFSGLFRSRDKPANRVGGGWNFLFGSTTSGKAVNERTAMQTSAVYACVRILAESEKRERLGKGKIIEGFIKDFRANKNHLLTKFLLSIDGI